MFLSDANNLTGKVIMKEIFNRYGVSPTYSQNRRDRTLEAVKVAWAGKEKVSLDADRTVDGIVASLGEHLRSEAPHLRPKGPRIVPEMAQRERAALKDKDIH
jgi:hypothetical protein